MMTETEAKQTWCPMARRLFEYSEEVSHNRDVHDKPASRCLGSGCGVWRWGNSGFEDMLTGENDPAPGGEWRAAPLNSGEIATDCFGRTLRWRREVPRVGYCGLGGKP